jgi:TetR/AcrR family transcriptional regulator, transcriptional repressor for nem operon
MAANQEEPRSNSGDQGRSDTNSRILDISERLVQLRGFNGFSYADVASELKITKASLHYHYPGKADLGKALIERYASRFIDALDAIDQQERDPLAKLEAYAKIYADVLNERRMCLCGMLAAGYDTLPSPMQEAVIDFFDVNEAWLTRVLDQGVAEGKLVLSGSPTEAAQAIVSGLEGAMLIARPYDDVKRFDTAASRLLASLVRAAPAAAPSR